MCISDSPERSERGALPIKLRSEIPERPKKPLPRPVAKERPKKPLPSQAPVLQQPDSSTDDEQFEEEEETDMD